MTIHAAIFDIGNVLLPFDYERAANRLIAGNAPTRPPNREAVVAAKHDLEIGAISRREFLDRVLPEFNHNGDEAAFIEVWSDIFDANPAIDALVERLAATLPLYLLSNISCIHREHIHRTYPVFARFRDGIYSYEAGMLKPDPAIFRLAAERFGVNPARTIYIDDMPENVEAAARAGFVAIAYDHRRHHEAEARIADLLAGGASPKVAGCKADGPAPLPAFQG